MKKYKFLKVAFVICMAMFLAIPSVVNASVSGSLIEENLKEVEPPYYIESMLGEKIYLEDENGNVEVDKTAEYGMKYDKSTNTLTLEDYDGFAFVCSMKNDFKIKVVGENTIHPVFKSEEEAVTSGIETLGRLEFIGDGTLIFDAENVRGVAAVEKPEDIFYDAPVYVNMNRRVIFNGPTVLIKEAKVGFRTITGPNARTVEIKKGKITLDSWWNNGGEIVISGGEVGVKGTILAAYNVEVTGGSVKASELDTEEGDVIVTGGTVDLEDNYAALPWHLVLGDNIAVIGDNLKIEKSEYVSDDGRDTYRIIDTTTEKPPKKVKLVEYNFKEESEKQELNIKDKGSITFAIDSDYEAFKNGGKVFVDGEELSKDKYTSKAGSTIITLEETYAKSLAKGEHTLAVEFGNGAKVTTNFTVVEKEVTVEPEEEIKPEVKPEEETKPEVKPEEKPEEEVKPETKPEENPGIKDEDVEVKPEIKDEVIDKVPETEVKDETPNTGRQEVNVQAIVAVVMLGVVGAVVVSKKRA